MITFFYASILGVLFFLISIETINARRRNKISLGVGADREIESIVSAHDNFSSYTPILVILLYGLEASKEFPIYIVHIFGVLIFLGRILHFNAFRKVKMDFKSRVRGMKLTLWSLLIMSFLNVYAYLKSFYSQLF
jgi:uncharacterized membrane protein YecN with MAPEG domain